MRTVVNSLEESDDPVDSDGKCLCVSVRFDSCWDDKLWLEKLGCRGGTLFKRGNKNPKVNDNLKYVKAVEKIKIIWSMLSLGEKKMVRYTKHWHTELSCENNKYLDIFICTFIKFGIFTEEYVGEMKC